MRELADLLGLMLQEPAGPREAKPFIDLLLTVRNDLRTAKEYGLADNIRTELADLGIIVEDGPEGSTWRAG